MLHSVNRSAPPPPPPVPAPRALPTDQAQAYRADWRLPATEPMHGQADTNAAVRLRSDDPAQAARIEVDAPRPAARQPDSTPATAIELSSHPNNRLAVAAATASPVPATARADAAETHRNALLAADVYRDVPAPPAGTRVATQQELDRLGITPDLLAIPNEGFRARVYVTGEPGQERYTVAFRGSQEMGDWRANLNQALGNDTPHYRNALEIGQKLSRIDAEVNFTGHSLGGGLAATAALASGRHADTFNASGLSDATISQARTIADDAGVQHGAADNHRVPGEILTFVQEDGDRVLGGLVDAPEAYGTQHDLPLVRPEGKNWFEAHSRIDRHGMDWVLAATASQAAR